MSDIVLDIAQKAKKASSFIAAAKTAEKNKVFPGQADAGQGKD